MAFSKAEILQRMGIPSGAAVELAKDSTSERLAGVGRIGIPDADDEESAIKLANACKARLNELIGALKG